MASAPDSNFEVEEDIAVSHSASESGNDSDSHGEPELRGDSVPGSEPDPEGTPELEILPESGSEPSPSLSPESSPAWPDDQLERAVAALLFASSEPLTNARIAAVLEHTTPAHVAAALDRVSARLVSSGLPFELVAIAGGWQMFSARDMADVVARFTKARREEKVSPATLETLAVVAYRQPVTKAEIEAVRGVQVGPILRALVDRGLIKVAGRSEDPGHALLYVTTRKFLDIFGLADLADLPRDAELVRDS